MGSLAERMVNAKTPGKKDALRKEIVRGFYGASAYRVRKKARLIFSDDESAEKWLNTEAPALGGAKPIDLLDTEEGANQVEGLIFGLAHGNFQ